MKAKAWGRRVYKRKGGKLGTALRQLFKKIFSTGRREVKWQLKGKVKLSIFFSFRMDNDQAEEKKWKIQQWGIKFVKWCQEGTELVWKLKGDGLCLSSNKSTWQQIEVGLTWKEVKSVVCSECEPDHSTVTFHGGRELCVHTPWSLWIRLTEV